MKRIAFFIAAALVAGQSAAEEKERSYVASFACSHDNLTGGTFDYPGVLVVHVFDSSGEPIPGAEVQIVRRGEKSLAAKLASDAAGRAVVKDLRDGSYTVLVLMQGFFRRESKPVEIRRGCTGGLSVPLQVIDLRHSSVRGAGRRTSG